MLDPKRTRPNVNDTKDGLDLSLFCVQIVIVYSGLVQDGRSCAKGLRQKVWTRTKILSSNICYFIEISWFVANHALFGRLFFGQKQCFWARSALLHINIMHIILNYISKIAISENSDYAPDEIFYGNFCSRQKAVNFCPSCRFFSLSHPGLV